MANNDELDEQLRAEIKKDLKAKLKADLLEEIKQELIQDKNNIKKENEETSKLKIQLEEQRQINEELKNTLDIKLQKVDETHKYLEEKKQGEVYGCIFAIIFLVGYIIFNIWLLQ